MQRFLSYTVLIAFILTFFPVVLICQDVDITGMWVGSTEIPDQGTDEMTMVIKKEDGEYAATVSDTLGMLQETECEDVEFKEGTLSCSITVFNGYESMTVWITLSVDGDKMSGTWETEDGDQGSIEFKRQ